MMPCCTVGFVAAYLPLYFPLVSLAYVYICVNYMYIEKVNVCMYYLATYLHIVSFASARNYKRIEAVRDMG